MIETVKHCIGSNNAEKEVRYDGFATQLVIWMFPSEDDFPITPARRSGFGGSNKGTYIVCLDCGKEFGYNWQQMKVGEAVQAVPVSSHADTVAVAHR